MNIKAYIKRILLGDIDYKTVWRYREKALTSRSALVRGINKCKYYKQMNKFNAFIPLQSHFEDMPMFAHNYSGIFISVNAQIGKNCVIFHQVTIGSNTLPDSNGKGAPKIGNNVYIGCGAKIIGNVTVGDNVRIGANCVVTKDIPDNCTVVAPHPRIIEHTAPKDNRFVSFENMR